MNGSGLREDRKDSRQDAVFALRWFRESRDVPTQAPNLHDALRKAKQDGVTHLILDGKLFATDRLGEKTTSVKGEQIDAWYSGKAHEPGGNVQADGARRVSRCGSATWRQARCTI